MINWYNLYKTANTRSKFAPSVISSSDYLKYTKLLANGIFDEQLLNLMLEQARQIVTFIATNTNYAREPHSSPPPCNKCSSDDITFFDDADKNDIKHDEVLSHKQYIKLMKMYPDGFWLCSSCNNLMGYWKYMSELSDEYGRWMYSDQSFRLIDTLNKARMAKNFGDKNAYFQKLLQFVHGSGNNANWFIEGGKETLNKVN